MAASQYEYLAAGREADLLIAEKMFGKSHCGAKDLYSEDASPVPFYTTNDKDANELVEAVFEKFHPAWQKTPDGHYCVLNYVPESGHLLPGWNEADGRLRAEADTLALAISRFVLMWEDRAGGGK